MDDTYEINTSCVQVKFRKRKKEYNAKTNKLDSDLVEKTNKIRKSLGLLPWRSKKIDPTKNMSSFTKNIAKVICYKKHL